MEAETPTPAGPAKRLMIREMVLENFKSYAGKQPVGPFHKCFSSVVGPNGSGKSNVIDAMLFVFGKRAKQLRLNKVSELIHNSSNHRNLEMAKVSVYFQEIIDTGEETFEVVPESHFAVSRTAHRNNSSNYFIDERRSNFGEVTALLKEKGIDLDNNRFLILQGEVEQIAMMKPKSQGPHDTGLLEYLEDIIGTDKYVAEIEESSKRLEGMNDKRQTMVQRLKIVEKERDGLEGARLAAEAYLDKERECTETQCLVYQWHLKECEESISTLTTGSTELKAKLEYEQGKKKGGTAELLEATKRYEAERAAQLTIQEHLDRTTDSFKEYERKDVKLREDIKHLKAKLTKLTQKLAADSASAEESAAKATAAEQAGPGLQRKIEDLGQKLRVKEEELEVMKNGIKDEVEGYQKALQNVRAELAPWEKKIAEVTSRQSTATAERDLVLKQQADAEERVQAAKQGAVDAAAAAKAKQREIQEMKVAVADHRAMAAAKRGEAKSAAADLARLEGGHREARAAFEQRRSEASSRRSQGAIAEALAAAKQSGKIPGIYGRLGDLGAIDKQYDIAVSTACGGLDHIVVEDSTAAMRCVELVRQRQLGVVTCLMLDKQQHLAKAAAEKASPPEGVKRLIDLVKVRDEKLRVAFFAALQNTLVARDLDQAARIAYAGDRRWSRVVTLQGDMINETGTMSGGGGKPRAGRMCIGTAAPRLLKDTKEAAADLAASESAYNTSKQALEDSRRRLEAAETAATAAEKAAADLELGIPKAVMEVEALQKTVADLSKRSKELQAATKVTSEDAQRLKTLEASIAATEKELKPLEKSSEGLRKRVAALEQQIEDAGGQPLKKLKSQAAQLQEDVAASEERAAKGKVEGEVAAKQAEKMRKACVKTEQEVGKVKDELEKAEKSMKELEGAAMEVALSQKKIAALLKEKSAELAIIKADFDAKTKEVNTIRSVEVELEAKIADLKSKLETETKARESNRRRLNERRKKLAELLDREDLLPMPSDEDLTRHKLSDLEFKLTMLEEDLARMSPDMGAIEAYRQKEADYNSKVEQLDAATAERDGVRRAFEDVKKRRLDGFMAGFGIISLKLKEMYQMITLGGDAELELVDSLDPFSEGIVFSVRPPKKSWKNIANLSGGEKTLSSLSLVFALHHFKPTPLYVMDEIDAALDFKNVSIVAHYIKERTKDAQFVIISLRNNMFELADRLVGIYKTDNATKSIAINPGEFAVGGNAAPPPTFQVGLASA